ncbi:hypothetical protein QZH41_020614 [Actinostola sp. cb2023]|nr:hypothetical protein QZH41_020614 [Actinostola sp. cb2023]
MKVERLETVVAALHKLTLCSRCILRFIDERNSSLYEGEYEAVSRSVCEKYGIDAEIVSDEKENGESKEDARDVLDHSCTVCLGILQSHECITKQIEDAIESSEIEYQSFTFFVSIPLCCLVRQHSIFLYLKEKFSGIYADKNTVDSLPSIKEVFKWVCGPALGISLGVYFQHESSFQVSIHFGHNGNEELEFLTEFDPAQFKERKAKRKDPKPVLFSVTSVRRALEDLDTADKLRKYTYCPPQPPSYKCHCTQVSCSHSSILLAGRYNKYSRRLPQTPWMIDGERKLESSVQVVLVFPKTLCKLIISIITDYRFSSGGREDIDVCMLGTGRPFVVECMNPHKNILSAEFLSGLQKEINSSTADIAIRDLQVVTKENYGILKEAESTKTKTYSCQIWTEKEITKEDLLPLNDIKDLTLKQKTPLRVLHRRPVAIREKVVHNMSSEWIDDHHFRLYLKTMAGTYVKEFVHGDFGRTKPNLGTLMETQTDILELDVESVDVDWPPSLDNQCHIDGTSTMSQETC